MAAKFNSLNRCRLLVLGITISCFTACAPPPRVAVVERSVVTVQSETEKIGGSIIRIVQPGDTLHSIAFGLGLNVNELASWNDMADTSKLIAGKQLRLTKPPGFKYKPVAKSNAPAKVKAVPAARKPAARPSNVPAKISKKPNTVVPSNAKPKWVWPTQGKVIGRYAISQGRQGIDILAKPGQSVVAASAGEVVYVGNGLKGYGNLIIIKHNEQYLSAYAHNHKIFVKEGQVLRKQQSIASVGRNREGKTALHFQIRKDGKPINPLAFLPTG